MKGLPAGPLPRNRTLRDGTVRWNTGLDFVF